MAVTVRLLTFVGLLLASPLLGPSPAAAQEPAQWQATPANGELSFSAWYEGEAVTGRFRRFEVRVTMDESGRAPVALEVEVETGSADMNDREVNAELAEPEWFDVANFPAASFRSSDIRLSGERYIATGVLRIKGIEHPLELPLAWDERGGTTLLTGQVNLSRHDWQIGTGEWSGDTALADRVEVRYDLKLNAVR